jgi:hypothetical protein
MSAIRYTTREAVKAALDIRSTARSDGQVDDAIDAGTDAVLSLTNREFRPKTATKYYPWPDNSYAPSWTLYLDQQPDWLIELTQLVSGGVAIGASGYFLEPQHLGPPYSRIEINLGSSSAFTTSTSTNQRSIALSGTWGFQLDYSSAGTTAEALDGTETGLDVDAAGSAAIGVGDLLLIGSEWLWVTGRSSLDTAQNTTGSLAASATADGVGVADGTGFAVGEVLTIGTERMLVVDIIGNTLTVKRQHDGTTLQAHSTNADIFAARTLTIERAAQGSSAASHSSATAISRHRCPRLVESLALAEALDTLLQRKTGYARTVGSGDAETEASGRALTQLRKQVFGQYGRKARKDAI